MGNSSEFKNCIVFDEAQIPHFNYVGDSIVGYKAHLAAGVILSNVRLDRAEVTVTTRNGMLPTGLINSAPSSGTRRRSAATPCSPPGRSSGGIA